MPNVGKKCLVKNAWESKKLCQIRSTRGTVTNMGKECNVKNAWERKKLSQIRSTRGIATQKRSTWRRNSYGKEILGNENTKKSNNKNQWWNENTEETLMENPNGFSLKKNKSFLSLELENSISKNVRSFFRVGSFYFLEPRKARNFHFSKHKKVH